MQVTDISIEQINPAPYNPRLDLKPGDPDYDRLEKVVTEFDLVEPLIWNKRTGNLVGGHQRLKILKKRGDKSVKVSVVDLPLSKEKALNVALNKTGGDWDLPALKDLLIEIDTGEFDIELTGFGEDEIERLMASLPGEIIEDEVPEPPEEPVTKPGDLWLLGDHRLLCGDSTVASDMKRLMGQEHADLIFTDPPYGVAYVGKTKKALTIQNDALGDDKTRELVADALMIAPLKSGGSFYVCSPAGNTETFFRLAVTDAGLLLKQCLVWVKQHFVMGRQDYHWRHESILYGWKPGASHFFGGGRSLNTVLEFSRPAKNAEHPTMKPVALVAHCIGNSSKGSDLVLDLFGGSGTTIIAAEQLGRRCFALEIDPRYCDVIVNRFINFTGTADKVFLTRGEKKVAHDEL